MKNIMRKTTQSTNFVFYVKIDKQGFKLFKNEYPSFDT